MEDFGSLSITDEPEKVWRNEQLHRGISELSIGDNSRETARSSGYSVGVSPQIMSKFMQHFPVSPSPLRNEWEFVEEMEIDDEYDGEHSSETEDLETKLDEKKDNSNIDGLAGGNIFDNKPNLKDFMRFSENSINNIDEPSEEINDLNDHQETSSNRANVIKALLSPTTLGVVAATKDEHANSSDMRFGSTMLPIEDDFTYKNSQDNSRTADYLRRNESDNTLNFRDNLRKEPIQVAINNNNFFYPSGFSPMVPTHNLTMMTQENLERNRQRGLTTQQHSDVIDHFQDYYRLPDPWSPHSRPASRISYILTSYLQMFLNVGTGMIVLSFLLSFGRALKQDLRSSWAHHRQELENESLNCRAAYELNKCGQTPGLPALRETCRVWETCMTRDNDVFFRARSALSAQLLGDIINSFVEPIGWKAVTVIMMGIMTWTFSSNFLLGFVRAKSYYGGCDKNHDSFSQSHNINWQGPDRETTEKIVQPLVKRDVAGTEAETTEMNLTMA